MAEFVGLSTYLFLIKHLKRHKFKNFSLTYVYKIKTFMKVCENCENEHSGTYGSGRFCSKKCAKAFSTKAKRKEINEKVSKKRKENAHKDVEKICPECKKQFAVHWNKRNNICCSSSCARKLRSKDPIYIQKISNSLRNIYKNEEKRKHLRDIGRKGGFGTKGKTKNGTQYQSKIEKQCFEWLEENNIKFEAHKYIPNSSKISDIYLMEKNLWIEIDGINREKKKKWLGQDYNYWLNKLEIYKQNNLQYKIVYTLEELIGTIV